jgi:hypothetical protein
MGYFQFLVIMNSSKSVFKVGGWWFIPVILTLGRQVSGGLRFQASLGK